MLVEGAYQIGEEASMSTYFVAMIMFRAASATMFELSEIWLRSAVV